MEGKKAEHAALSHCGTYRPIRMESVLNIANNLRERFVLGIIYMRILKMKSGKSGLLFKVIAIS